MNAEHMLRIFIAAICAGVIGFERSSRSKEAGIRTHIIVGVGACLMTLVSKYGFNDVLVSEALKLDPARVAAQIVSGIGFLGAGMIIVRKNVVSGLTTAAGLWTTAGIGMAIGTGMVWAGIFCTILIYGVQYVLSMPIFKLHRTHIVITVSKKEDIFRLNEYIESNGIKIKEYHFHQGNSGLFDVNYSLGLPHNLSRTTLTKILTNFEYVRGVE